MGGCIRSERRLLLPPLLRKDFAGDFEHSLEALAALSRVLAEPVHGDFLDAVLDLLPAAAHGDDFGRLVEDGLARSVGGGVAHGFLHGEEFAPGQVLGAHCDGLFARVDVGDFVHEAGFVGAEEGFEPGRQGLFACNEALGAKLWRYVSKVPSDLGGIIGATYDSGLVVKRAVQYIHSDDMLGLIVPRAVLAPVVCGHFFP